MQRFYRNQVACLNSSQTQQSTMEFSLYEFFIPQQLVGLLIGSGGVFVHQIRVETNASIFVRDTPDEYKICAVHGTQYEIDAALAMIRRKFPDLTIRRIHFSPVLANSQLRLVEGINNNTIVSRVITPHHLFLQQPTHPTFPNFTKLYQYMQAFYKDTNNQAPSLTLSDPIEKGLICVAYFSHAWHRVAVESFDNEQRSTIVQFLDIGGYEHVRISDLRLIHADFVVIPFQAIKCVLANVQPVECDGEHIWTEEAREAVQELTRCSIVFTQVIGYLEDGITPLVHIYVLPNSEQRPCVFLNKVLVSRGLARWVHHTAR